MTAGDTNFNVKNTLNVNGAVQVNSTGISFSNTLSLNSTSYAGTANSTNYVGTVTAANVVSNAQLVSNLANYQTLLGLASNVAVLTANNTSYVGAVTAANVVSNAQLSSNLTSYVNTTANYTLAGNIFVNSAILSVGNSTSNITSNTTTLLIGNSTVNATVNSSGFSISNSTLTSIPVYANIASQAITGGAIVTSYSIGTTNSTVTSVTINCGNRPLQYLTNNGAFTCTAPSNDGSCIVLITNGTAAGAISFSGFSVGTNTGDTLTTTSTNKFMIYVVRVNGTSTYSVKALQ